MKTKLLCPKCESEMRIVHEGRKTYFLCEKCGFTLKRMRKQKKEVKKLSKEEQIQKFKELAKKYGIDEQNIDFESIVDGKLSYGENLERIREEIKKLNPELIVEDFNPEKEEARFNEHLRKVMEEEFQNDIERIKERSTPELDKYFRTLKELIRITIKSDLTGLIVFGEAGLGKTYQVLKTLGEEGLKINEDFVYVSTHITALELFNLLYKFNDRIIILDDCEKLLEDLKTIGILKSALWSSVGKRYVFYYSTTDKREAPEQFEFKGKIILLFNRIPTRYREVIESLKSRVLNYNLSFTYEEKIKIMYELAKIYKIPFKVVDFIKERTNPATNLNFRTLLQLNLIQKYYQENPSEMNGKSWELIAQDIFEQNTDPIMKVVCELMKSSNLSVKEQVKKFTERTGLGRTSFFYYKAKLKGKVKSWNEYN